MVWLDPCILFSIRADMFLSPDPTVATTVLVLQTLVRSPSFPATASRAAVITRLASYLYTGKVTDPVARSTIYWLVGQFAREGLLEGCGPDVVRLGAKQFAEEVRLSSVLWEAHLMGASGLTTLLSHHPAVGPGKTATVDPLG